MAYWNLPFDVMSHIHIWTTLAMNINYVEFEFTNAIYTEMANTPIGFFYPAMVESKQRKDQC